MGVADTMTALGAALLVASCSLVVDTTGLAGGADLDAVPMPMPVWKPVPARMARRAPASTHPSVPAITVLPR